MTMKRFNAIAAILSAMFCICLAVGLSSASAQDKPMVRVSGQPTMHGMPTWEIMEQGIKDLPINIKYMMFPSGAPRSRPWQPANGMSGPSARCP